MQQFKAGDVLECRDAEGSQGRLVVGQHYVARHDSYDAFVVLEETGLTEWMVSRFVLANSV